MKKILIGIGLIVLGCIVAAAYWYTSFTRVSVVIPEPVATTTLVATSTTEAPIGSPRNATYLIEGVPVTLVNGVAETPAAPDSASVIHTEYFGNDISYDFNHDGRMDTAFLLTQSTGGTGVFYYVVAALNAPPGYVGSEGVRLGDRVAPQSTSLSTREGVIAVHFVDRLPSEPFSVTPSVGKTLYVAFDSATQKLLEVPPPSVSSMYTTSTTTMSSTLTGKKWQWVRTNYTDGRVFVPKKTASFSLTFSTDGTVSGTTDCNSVGGPYTTSGTNTVSFGAMAMTRMYCDGSEEGVFADLLGQIASYTVTQNGELHLGLKKDSGVMILH